MHGHRRVDDYAWLRDRESAEVLEYLRAESAWTEREMASTAVVQEALFEELRSRVAEDDVSVPAAKGAYEYYVRMVAGRDYPFYCRRYAHRIPAMNRSCWTSTSGVGGTISIWVPSR